MLIIQAALMHQMVKINLISSVVKDTSIFAV